MQHFYSQNIRIGISIILCLAFFSNKINAQDGDFVDNAEKFQVKIKRTEQPIKIDGILDEAAWQDADVAKDFWKKLPVVEEGANPKTQAQLTYDDNFLYVAFICEGDDNYIVQTLKRDQGYWQSDNVGILIDPVGQSSNGFMFGISPLGVQMEGLLQGGNRPDLDRNWDNKWFSATQTSPTQWVAEIAIPFKTLRYNADLTEWRINFIRNATAKNEYHTWAPVPQQFRGLDLNFYGSLIWDAAPKKVKSNFSIIPYITGGLDRDFENEEKTKGRYNAGLDAKISLTSSLNLDLTLNPDFSQIEVDQQVTNLSSFSIFLPEKRTFFLENADIFSTFGIRPIRPFFSRTIGLNEDGGTVPILFGARLSGNLDSKTRIGAMNMQTRGDDTQHGQNFSTLALHRRVGKRSLLKGLFTNRQGYNDGEFVDNEFGRNAGLELDLTSKNGEWAMWSMYHHSWQPEVTDKNSMQTLGGGYFGKKFNVWSSFTSVNENYVADQGFVTRLDNFYRDTTIRRGFFQSFTMAEYFIFPENDEVINQHQFGFENFIVYFRDGTLNERMMRFRYFMNLKNSSRLRFRIDNTEENLQAIRSFATDNEVLVGNYNNYIFNIQFESDQRKVFRYDVNFRHGGFYNGTLTTYQFNFNFRRQPWGNFSLGLERNDIRFPDFEPIEFVDLNSRIEINFSQKMFWTTFAQYNIQNNQFNVNSRLQYRFSPMSDFFIVYTDNYNVLDDRSLTFLETIEPKNRALVFKLNYWFTL